MYYYEAALKQSKALY